MRAPSGEWLAGWRACQEAAALAIEDTDVEEVQGGGSYYAQLGDAIATLREAAKNVRALQPTTPDPTPSSGAGKA